MRLICGFCHFDGRPAERERLDTMVAAMIEPGLEPKVASCVEGSLAMAVLDFASHKPFEIARSETGTILADDSRFDEPEELARMLQVPKDDDLLLALLEQHGEAGLPGLLGDFAFAAWIPQTGTLVCARDAMGIRPLFVTRTQRPDFAFASLPRALHAGGFASRQLDDTQFVQDMLNIHAEPERTLFKDIIRLAPGQLLRVSAQETRSRIFWQLNADLAGSRQCTPQAAADDMRVALERAVQCRLPAQGPVAAHLSGGLDSSALSVLAARMLRSEGRSLLAYSFLSSSPVAEDERPYVETVLRQEADIDWTPLTVEDWDGFFLPQMECDHLFPADAGNLEVRVCADAAKRGARMLLSGWGGDEGATFNGRGALAEALLRGHWRYLVSEIRAICRNRRMRLPAVLLREVMGYLVSNSIRRRLSAALGRTTLVSSRAHALLQAEFSGVRPERYNIGPDAARNRFLLLTSPHLSRRAEQWALIGARHGVAISFPMLDRRVVELALSLPSEVFQRNGWRRNVFRDAMANVLPDKIRLRHGKIVPIEEVAEKLASRRMLIRERLRELRAHPQVARVFDLDKAEKILDSEVRDESATALRRLLTAAEFLKQNYCAK